MRRHRTNDNTPIADRLATCSHVRLITPQESWESNERRFVRKGRYVYPHLADGGPYREPVHEYIEPNPSLPIEWSTSYGDWTELKQGEDVREDTFALLDYTSGSDYSGSLVEVSNRKAIEELCQACGFEDGEDYLDYHGGYGTRALAVRVKALEGEDESGFKASLLETIEGLEDYPLVDESLHSELEMEAQNQAWEDWGCSEFKTELGKYFAAVIRSGIEDSTEEEFTLFNQLACSEDLAECSENEDWVSDDQANRWFWELSEYANEYWVNEQGEDCCIDMEDVVRKGIGRKLDHWTEREKKRDALVEEMETVLENAFGMWFWGEIAYAMKRQETER
jgi:hypothetical protein